MRRRSKKVTTHLLAGYISETLDVPFVEAKEILELEHRFTKEMVDKGEEVNLDGLVIFKPCISKYGNKSCKAVLSRAFRHGLRGLPSK